MYRGTTPTLIFTLPFECEKVDVCNIAFAQGKYSYSKDTEIVLEKTLADCATSGNTLTLTLSENDTLKLDSTQDVEIQLRVKCGRTSFASDIFKTTVGRILKDGVSGMKIDVKFEQVSQEIPLKLFGGNSAEIDTPIKDTVLVPAERDHQKLQNREAPDQHPIAAITQLQTELDNKIAGAGFLSNLEIQAILDS